MGQKKKIRIPELVESILDPDPLIQFQRWFQDAVQDGLPQPEAMTLATATSSGRPSARLVLMKQFDDRGFVFFTDYRSSKGSDLLENPYAALVFHWEAHGRQVRVEGGVERIGAEDSDAYFDTRPVEHKLSTLVSEQSQPATRENLDRRFEELRAAYAGKKIPRPVDWGGYRVNPVRIEFWQRRFARLNDRVLYERNPGAGWYMRRLSP